MDFVFRDGLLFIALKKISDQPAYYISVDFDKPIHGVNGTKEINRLPLFRDTAFLPPQKEITTFLDSSAAYFAREEPTEILTTVCFENSRGRRYSLIIPHNLEIYREIGYIRVG